VLQCADGYVELLTLEDRQWRGLVKLMGSPEWARDSALSDSLERSRRGTEINRAIRSWARLERTADVVARAQALGVPMAKYSNPAEVVFDPHEGARGLFEPIEIPEAGRLPVLVAPFHVDGAPLALGGGPPRLGQHQHLLQAQRRRRVATAEAT